MSTSPAKAPAPLSIDIPGQLRIAAQVTNLDKLAARHGFYPNLGLDVYVHDAGAQSGSEIQLVFNGKVISTHRLKPDETGTAIKLFVEAKHLTHGEHVLSYRLKQSGGEVVDSTCRATLGVRAEPLSHLGFDVSEAESPTDYLKVNVKLRSGVARLSAADEVINLIDADLGSFLFSPDGQYLYAKWIKGVAKIDLEKFRIVENYPVDAYQLGGFSADGRFLYATNWSNAALIILDLQENRSESGAVIGEFSGGVVVSHDASQLFVATRDHANSTSSLTVVDRASQEIVKKIPVGPLATDIVLSPHPDQVFVACLGVLGKQAGVFVVNPVTEKVIHISVGTVWYLTLSPNGEELYAFGDETITVIDTASLEVKRSFQLAARSLAVSPDGKLVYVSPYGFGNEGVIRVYESHDWSLVRAIDTSKAFLIKMTTDKSNGDLWVAFSDA